MKIGIDTGQFAKGDAIRGIGVYNRLLVENLKKLKDLKVEQVDAKRDDLSKYDLIHYIRFHPYFISIPFRKQTKSIITIHDLIPLIYPEHFPPGIKGSLRLLIQKYLIKKIDAVIAVSETSKKDIVRFLGIPVEKIYVIHLASEDSFKKLSDGSWKNDIRTRYKLPERFILNVGDVNYNKNILGLAEACKMINVPLVLVGKQLTSKDFDPGHPENRSFSKLIEKYGTDKDILRLGFVSDDDLVKIYNLATIYCQPSFYEGFGLSVLKAFACEIPVVAAKTQALVEIGGPACVYADPNKPKDIADKISQVLKDRELAKELVERGKVLAKNYSWEKTARETFEVYKKVLAK